MTSDFLQHHRPQVDRVLHLTSLPLPDPQPNEPIPVPRDCDRVEDMHWTAVKPGGPWNGNAFGHPRQLRAVALYCRKIFAPYVALARLGLKRVFIASDANAEEIRALYRLLDFEIYRPSTTATWLDEEIAIIDQSIAAHGAWFVGTEPSTFSRVIMEEREIMGLPVAYLHMTAMLGWIEWAGGSDLPNHREFFIIFM